MTLTRHHLFPKPKAKHCGGAASTKPETESGQAMLPTRTPPVPANPATGERPANQSVRRVEVPKDAEKVRRLRGRRRPSAQSRDSHSARRVMVGTDPQEKRFRSGIAKRKIRSPKPAKPASRNLAGQSISGLEATARKRAARPRLEHLPPVLFSHSLSLVEAAPFLAK